MGCSPITLRIFTNTTDRDAIYGLRYRAYRHAELIGPAGAEEFSDSYDDLATTKTIGAFYNDACVGSLRLAFGRGGAKAATMPCQSIFGDVDILAASAAGQLVEFTRMVVDPAITNNSLQARRSGRNIFFGISREEIDLVSTLFADEATSRAA